MSDPAVPPPITDAELLGRYAGEAIALGRFRMAAALTSLAQRAADFEARAARIERDDRARLVPVIGATREEHPRVTPIDAFHMRQDGRLSQVSAANGRPADPMTDTVITSAGSHAPNACAAQLPGGECGALIGWSDGFSSVARKGWYHLDHTQVDHQHAAVPTLEAIDALDGRRPDVTRTDLRVADWVASGE